jgi:hypothetical protein
MCRNACKGRFQNRFKLQDACAMQYIHTPFLCAYSTYTPLSCHNPMCTQIHT